MVQNQDIEQLRLLSIFHYIVAGVAGLFSMFPLIHLTLGIIFVSGALDNPRHGSPPPAFVGWVFIVAASAAIMVGLAMSICIAIAGRRLAKQKSYNFCLVMAGIECIFMPFGTVLGVFTILVLQRPSVRALFDGATESVDHSTLEQH